MKTTKHSKAPWKWNGAQCTSADGEIVGHRTSEYYRNQKKSYADMHLIAQAPNMLDALKEIVAHDIETNGCTEPWPELIRSVIKARAVIAAAERDTPPWEK